jgi:thiamine biosynthesis lipoprotein
MACDFSVHLPPQVVDPTAVGETALAVIDDMEDLLSVYRSSSAFSCANAGAAERPVRIDRRAFELLELSARLSEQTGGAFDITAGALVRAWGFLHGPRCVPTEADRHAALARTGWRHLQLDSPESTVAFDVAGLEINPGSIGKGYAIDRAVKRIAEDFGIDCVLMQGGSSSVHGVGSPPGEDRGWLVAIENPYDPKRKVATVRLKNRAMGTSGTANQCFETGGRRYGHLIDPRTGWPAGELASASVLAADGATADALATALFIMGLDKAADFCKDHPEIGAVLVLKPADESHSAEPLRVQTFNLAKGEVDLRPERARV